MNVDQYQFQLHSFFRSTSSARVRIAANLKQIPLEYQCVNVRGGEQLSDEYSKVNPNKTVPVLTVTKSGHNAPFMVIRQSLAILEFFEEAFPNSEPLLPPANDLAGRAKVRELVGLIACDVQPPTNARILKRVSKIGGAEGMNNWAKDIMGAGLLAFDKLAESCAGQYSFGDKITLADVVLVPAVENATRYGVDLDSLPTVKRIFGKVSENAAFKTGNWRAQGDTPEDERPA